MKTSLANPKDFSNRLALGCLTNTEQLVAIADDDSQQKDQVLQHRWP